MNLPKIPERPLEGLRVLVADDTDGVLDLYREWLRRAGASVVTAADGAVAVGIWTALSRAQARLDAAVLDFDMPRMTGPAAAVRLRSLGFRGAIVGYSAAVEFGTIKRQFDFSGGDVVLPKGPSPADLTATLRLICGRSGI